MRTFRTICLTLGMALASVCSVSAFAADGLGIHLQRFVELDYGCSAVKFTAELAQNRQAQTMYAAVNSDLTREGHGFRQSSAADELALNFTIG